MCLNQYLTKINVERRPNVDSRMVMPLSNKNGFLLAVHWCRFLSEALQTHYQEFMAVIQSIFWHFCTIFFRVNQFWFKKQFWIQNMDISWLFDAATFLVQVDFIEKQKFNSPFHHKVIPRLWNPSHRWSNLCTGIPCVRSAAAVRPCYEYCCYSTRGWPVREGSNNESLIG